MSRFSLETFFDLKACGTTVRREVIGGLTTFVAMSYLVIVVPAMLADAGMDREAATAATIITTVFATLLMGLYANLPIAVAPGLGITAYFAYYVCGPAGFTWQAALGAVFISGVIFFILTVTSIRELIIDAIPRDLKIATSAGFGCFITLIGLKNCGIVIPSETGLTLGHLTSPAALTAIAGFFVTAALTARNVTGSILIGIVFTAAVSYATGQAHLPEGEVFSVSLPDVSGTFLALDFAGALSHGIVTVIFTLTMVDLFENIGTLIGLTRKAGLTQPGGAIKNVRQAFVSDSFGTMFAATMGTSTGVCYIESAAGIESGARTGLSSVVTALGFVLALFAVPLVSCVPTATAAPALILVGVLMMKETALIGFDDFPISVSAFLMIMGMPFTFNIATGLGLGFISYVVLMTTAGRAREVKPAMWPIALAFAVSFALR